MVEKYIEIAVFYIVIGIAISLAAYCFVMAFI